MPNNLKAFVRSVFPFLWSSAIAAIAHYAYHASPTHAAAILAVGGVFLAGLIRWLETHFPWVGVFLGWVGAPTYAPSAKATLKQTVAELQDTLAATQKELASWKSAVPATGSATLTADGNSGPVA